MKKISPIFPVLIAIMFSLLFVIGAAAKTDKPFISAQTTQTPTITPTPTVIGSNLPVGAKLCTETLPGTGTLHVVPCGELPNLWDQIIMGFSQFIQAYLLPQLPEHNSPTGMIQILINTIALFFRLTWIFAKGNLNLGWVFIFILYIIATRTLFTIVKFIFWVIRVIGNLWDLLPW